MKKILYLILPLIAIIVFLSVFRSQGIKNMTYLNDVKINDLIKYRIDNENSLGKFGEISAQLPGNISCSGSSYVGGPEPYIDLNYDYYGGDKSELKKLDQFWQSNKEKILLFNATTYFILVPDAQKITITLEVPYKQKFEVKRKDLENYFNKNLDEYYKNTTLWQKQIVKGVISSPQKLEAFFQTYKIQTIQ